MSLMNSKEEEEFSVLKSGFNVVKPSVDYSLITSVRIETSKYWGKRLLLYSFYMNIVTILCFVVVIVSYILKPLPHFFASTPNGQVYVLETVKVKI